jgi:hypothetical protein
MASTLRNTGRRHHLSSRHYLTIAASLAFLAISACSFKHPAGPEEPDPDPGAGPSFYHWLPALLNDQGAAQPSHELMEFLEDESKFFGDRQALVAILDRLGEAPQQYRASASGYGPGDEPFLIAIEVFIRQGRALLAGNLPFVPLMRAPMLETDEG